MKFKKCHLNREDQKPENPFNIRKRFFELHKRKFCFCSLDADRCSNVYAASHSISKSGSLKLISERSHVAALQGDFHFVEDTETYYDSVRIVELSINKASTFHGFCDLHDAKHFAHLDRLDLSDPRLFFWELAYRAAAFEKYRKIAAIEFADQVRLLDKGANLFQQQQIQFQANFQKWSHSEGLKNLEHLLKSIEGIYKDESFDQLAYTCLVTDRRLPFAGVGFFQPSMTMDGRALQRVNLVLRHELFRSVPHSEAVCIAAIPMKGATLLCLCALRHQKKSLEFIASMRMEEGKAVSHFLGTMLVSIENIYFTPSYLRSLGDHRLSLLKKLSSLGIAEDLSPGDVRVARSLSLFDDVSIIEQLASC